MSSASAREILVYGAYATVFALVGFLSLLAAIRWRSTRRIWLLLATAMWLHATMLLGGSAAVRLALGGPRILWDWVTAVGGYAIAIPWARLVEDVAGVGWQSSIRRVRQGFSVYAVTATVIDLFNGRPASLPVFVQPVVIALGASIFLANLVCGGVRIGADLRLFRAGYAVFMVAVIHDDLVAIGFVPWRWQTGQFGVLTFVGCLVYALAMRMVREQSHLRSIEHELATARRIQQALMPIAPPALDAATIAFRHVPAASVAGDLFQFLGAERDRVGMLVADVSGHGVPAALIASMVKVAAAA